MKTTCITIAAQQIEKMLATFFGLELEEVRFVNESGDVVKLREAQIISWRTPTLPIITEHEVSSFSRVIIEVPQTSSPLAKLLMRSVNEVEMSVRAANGANNADFIWIWQLVIAGKAMLSLKGYGQKSYREVYNKLMEFPELDSKICIKLRECFASNPEFGFSKSLSPKEQLEVLTKISNNIDLSKKALDFIAATAAEIEQK